MELTNKQKIILCDSVGIDKLLYSLPQKDFVVALGVHSYYEIEKKLGCTRSWITHKMRLGIIPEPSQKIMRSWYFTPEEVTLVEKVWKKQSLENRRNKV